MTDALLGMVGSLFNSSYALNMKEVYRIGDVEATDGCGRGEGYSDDGGNSIIADGAGAELIRNEDAVPV